jgi:type I restriction enzyme S subunit
MSSEWKRMKIGDLCDQFGAELQTGPFGSQLHSYDYTETGVPVVPTEAIDNGKINPGVLPKISKEKASELSRHTLRQGDILFARRGAQATGKTAITRRCDEGAICGTGAIRLRIEPAKSIVLPTFLATYLSSKETITWIRHHAIGATMPNLNEGIIRSIPILLPSLQEQEAVAHILGTLDDKIELNRKTNETLEAMAKALFRSWFVDFDPVRAKAAGRPTGLPAEISDLFPDSFEELELGEIPSGWSVGEIGQILNLQKDSLDPATAPDEVFDHYSIPAFDAGKHPVKELGSSIKSQKFLVGGGDLLVSKLNPSTPRVWIPFASSGRRAICSTEFLVCRTSSVLGRAYAYCLASSDAIVEAMTGLAGGTSNSHQRIRPGDFLALPCCIGTEMVRSAFLDVVDPLLDKSLVLRTESRSLSTTRDALLPKLISGEVRIPDAEKMLEQVGV